MASSGLYVNPNNGQTQAGVQPFRNILINGDMRIAQRGTTFTNISGSGVKTYTLDRWWIAQNGTASNNISQISSISLDGFTYAMRVQRPLNSTNSFGFYVGQGIESINSADLKNKNITLSFYIRKGENLSGYIYVRLVSGSGTDQDAVGSVNGGWTNGNQFLMITLDISTNWVKYSYTATVPSNCNQLGVAFIPAFSGTALAADYFDITGVQLEMGSVATPFEVRPYPVELQLCQRYFYRIGTTLGNFNTIVASGHMRDTISCDAMVTLPCVMRKMPTGGKGTTELIIYAGNGQSNTKTTESYTINVSLNNNSVWVRFTAATAIITGYGAIVVTNGQNSFMDFSAEL